MNMIGVRKGFQNLCSLMGIRVTRMRSPNRFQSMDESLEHLRKRGYLPKVIIDAGSNLGNWTYMAKGIYPDARFHLIEPQPSCYQHLQKIYGPIPKVTLHPFALTQPGVGHVWMVGSADVHGGDGSGAWVVGNKQTGSDQIKCSASTLDALVEPIIEMDDRTLLKLDLEGHELIALSGANKLLPKIEVLITEFQFFAGDDTHPIFADIHSSMQRFGFDLYDFASLSGRLRDDRLRMGDAIFVRRGSQLLMDRSWD